MGGVMALVLILLAVCVVVSVRGKLEAHGSGRRANGGWHGGTRRYVAEYDCKHYTMKSQSSRGYISRRGR
jgi:hypothetical protein